MAENQPNAYGKGVTDAMRQAAHAELSRLGEMVAEGKKVVLQPHLLFQEQKWVKAVRIQLRAQMERAIARDDAALRERISADEYASDINQAIGLDPGDRSDESASKRAAYIAKLTRKDLVDDLFTFTPGEKPEQSWGQKFSTDGKVHKNLIAKATVCMKVNSVRGCTRGDIEGTPVDNLNLGVTLSTSNKQNVGFAQSLTAEDWLGVIDGADAALGKEARTRLSEAGIADLSTVRISGPEIPFLQFKNLQAEQGLVGPERISEMEPAKQKEWKSLAQVLKSNDESKYLETKAGAKSRFLTEQRFAELSTGDIIQRGSLVNVKLATVLQTLERTEARGLFHLREESTTGVPGMMTINDTRATKITSAEQAVENQERIRRSRPGNVPDDVASTLSEVAEANAQTYQQGGAQSRT